MITKRPLYTNNEIVALFNQKFNENNDTVNNLAEKYDVENNLIELMADKSCEYNFRMLKIASDYLNIPYKKLVSFIEDKEDFCSLRANSTIEVKELNEVLNYLFEQMITQERFASI